MTQDTTTVSSATPGNAKKSTQDTVLSKRKRSKKPSKKHEDYDISKKLEEMIQQYEDLNAGVRRWNKDQGLAQAKDPDNDGTQQSAHSHLSREDARASEAIHIGFPNQGHPCSSGYTRVLISAQVPTSSDRTAWENQPILVLPPPNAVSEHALRAVQVLQSLGLVSLDIINT